MLKEFNRLLSIDTKNPVNLKHPLAQGLVSWWLVLPGLLGGKYFYDLVGMNYGVGAIVNPGNGAINTPSWVTSAKLGSFGALQFTQDINLNFGNEIDIISTPTITTNYSVSVWFNINSVPRNLLLFGTRGPSDNSFDLQINSTGFHSDIGTGSAWLSTSADATVTINLGVWNHVVYVVNTTGYSIYYNGNLVGSGSFSGVPLLCDPTHLMTIGAFKQGGSNQNGGGYIGLIDDVRVYNRTLVSNEVYSLYINSLQGYPNLLNHINIFSLSKKIQQYLFVLIEKQKWPFGVRVG